MLLVIGRDTDYNGAVYFDNITVGNPENPGEDNPENPGEDNPENPGEDNPENPGEDNPENPGESTGIKELYEFTNGLDGWEKDDWIGENVTVGDISHDAEGGRLKLPVDYTKVSEEEWKDATVCLKDSKGLDFSAYNSMSFDFYYNPSGMTKGTIDLKASASVKKDENTTEELFSGQKSVNDVTVSDAEGGLKKAAFVFKIDEEKAKTLRPEKMDIVISGVKTDYNGDVYIDNIRFFKTETTKIKELYNFNDGLQG